MTGKYVLLAIGIICAIFIGVVEFVSKQHGADFVDVSGLCAASVLFLVFGVLGFSLESVR